MKLRSLPFFTSSNYCVSTFIHTCVCPFHFSFFLLWRVPIILLLHFTMDALLHHSNIGPQVERLSAVWPFPEEYQYFVALERRFPGCFNLNFKICAEFGPEVYKHRSNNSMILVLQRNRENGTTWSSVLSTDWINTHRKLTRPFWIDNNSIQKNYVRISRNQLLFDNWKTLSHVRKSNLNCKEAGGQYEN